ncbi:MAG: ATP-dependent metallopeptidase FtsH/Yme1/Tma family protein, partial [Victivallales bacterium]|nr:ATP-dependent metallopeptidase FtsH/Yme1/Tma family protein [Victivallales bacterium]
MARNNQDKSTENKPQQPENKNQQFGRQILLWILIFISVPLACYYFMKDGKGAPSQFIASQFDTYLAEGRIDSVTLEEQSSSHVQILSGQYWLVSGE